MSELVERAMAAVRYWADDAHTGCTCEQCAVLRQALAALFAEAVRQEGKSNE